MPYTHGDTLLNKYRLEALIGQGAFAEAYRATHLALNAPRALKILRRDAPGVGSTEYADFHARFQLEAQLGAKLDHPNIIRVYDFEQDRKTLILAMEYAQGGSLAQLIQAGREKDQPIAIDRAIQIARDVSEGLAAIHALDAVHRDLKPSNILFDKKGHAKVADLGLAQIPGGPSLRSRLSQPLPHPGTPGYMSPEQEHTGNLLRPASDVYALGIVLFEMLTGRNYHYLKPGTRLSELRQDVPDWLDDLLVHMLAKEPNDRPWDGAEVASLLRKGCIGEDGKHPHHHKFWEKIPGWTWAVSASLALVGIILGAMLSGNGNSTTSTPQSDTSIVAAANTGTSTPVPTNTPFPTETHTPQPTNTPRPTETHTPTALPTPTLGIGSTWTRPADGMVMVYVPEGNFTMGSNDGASDEQPVHKVYLDAFWIDQTELTNAMYTLCVSARACDPPNDTSSYTRTSYYGNSQYDDYPVIYVSWNDASDYCAWAGARLPSEAEWEKAARGTEGRIYPWGNGSPNSSLLNYFSKVGDTTVVGSYPSGVSPYGALDMAGNVWEWVKDWYDSSYYANSPSSNPKGPASGDYRVLRGGSWNHFELYFRSAYRFRNYPVDSLNDLGFRCSRSLP